MTGEQLLYGLWAIFPEVVLLLLGILVITIDLIKGSRANARLFGYVTIGGATLALVVVIYQMITGMPEPYAFSGMVRVDMFSQMFSAIFLIALILAVFISLDVKGLRTNGEFYGLLIFSTVGMGFMALSNNIVMLYVALETTSIALYMLAGFIRESRVSTEAGIKYFLFGAFTSTVLLYGLSLLFGFTGGKTNYGEIMLAVQRLAASQETLPLMVALVLVTVGFGFKVAAVPFHMWTPDVYEGAPTPITAFISVASKAAGFAVFIRFFLIVFGPLQEQWIGLVAILAAVTMILGNLVALQQRNFKRMLAYSSIAQAGYILIGVAAVGELGTAAVLFYLSAYVLTNIAAFAVAEISTNATGSELIKDHGRTQPPRAGHCVCAAGGDAIAGGRATAGRVLCQVLYFPGRDRLHQPGGSAFAGLAGHCGCVDQHRGVVLLPGGPEGRVCRSGRGRRHSAPHQRRLQVRAVRHGGRYADHGGVRHARV